MRDEHRVLIDARDRIGNVRQIAALLDAGYAGTFSFEPFANELQHLADLAGHIRDSMNFIGAELRAVSPQPLGDHDQDSDANAANSRERKGSKTSLLGTQRPSPSETG